LADLDVACRGDHRELLERASGLNEEEIKLLAATLNPEADVAESVRRVPVRSVPVIRPPIVQASRTSMAGEQAAGSTLEPEVPSAAARAEESMARRAELTWVALPPKPSELEPLSAERYSVRMTVSKDFVDEFRQVKNALSHVVPGGKMEDVLRECMRIAREVCERRTRGSKPARAIRCPSRPVGEHRLGEAPADGASSSLEPSPAAEVRSTAAVSNAFAPTEVDASSSILEARHTSTKAMREEPGSRYLPVAVRREVFERDGGCCMFIGANGKRCRSTYQLQFHHKVPFARGGPATYENVTLHCARHNRHQAYEDYGASHMDRFVAVPRGRRPRKNQSAESGA
jgi:5-methylcytosine-specific restriction endonuclease McrA